MEEQTLGGYIKMIMNQQGLSGNQLAKKARVTQGTVRNLLKQGEDPTISSPHPHVLRAVGEALEIEPLTLFKLAGYIPEQAKFADLSPLGEYVGVRFDLLPQDKQRMFLRMLASFEAENASTVTPEEINDLAQVVRKLRKAHPMFIERKFNLRDEFGRVVGTFFDLLPEDRAARSIARRLEELFKNDATVVITPEKITQASTHPRGEVVLSLLLPRKEIQRSIERLYWLSHPSNTFGQEEETLSLEHQEGIRAMWLMLAEQTGVELG